MRARSSVRYSHWSGPSLAIALSLTASAAFGQAAAQSTPEATGPIAITAPAEGDTVVGRQVAIGWEAPGLTIVPAAEAQEETDLHAHFIVDGAYEVVPVYGSCLFRFEQHMARLERSLGELRIPNPHTRPQWRAIDASSRPGVAEPGPGRP